MPLRPHPLLLVAPLALAMASVAHAEPPPLAVRTGQVLTVIDGDTLIASMEGEARPEVVRLLGVDAPEDFEPGEPKHRWTLAAKRALATLVEGKTTRFEFAPDTERDRFGRLLAYVHDPKGRDANAILIARGFALHYTRYPHPRQQAYDRYQEVARQARRGVFKKRPESSPTSPPPRPAARPASTSLLPLPSRSGGGSAPAASAPPTPTTAPAEGPQFYVSVTEKIHRVTCENKYVQRDLATGKGRKFSTLREAQEHGRSSCKLCRPYVVARD